jgi:DNA-binding transcriptional LysR family regulator
LDFRQIRYALSVAKERSFTKASVRLNISQSAVSEQVKLLEEEPITSSRAGGLMGNRQRRF